MDTRGTPGTTLFPRVPLTAVVTCGLPVNLLLQDPSVIVFSGPLPPIVLRFLLASRQPLRNLPVSLPPGSVVPTLVSSMLMNGPDGRFPKAGSIAILQPIPSALTPDYVYGLPTATVALFPPKVVLVTEQLALVPTRPPPTRLIRKARFVPVLVPLMFMLPTLHPLPLHPNVQFLLVVTSG